MRFLLYLAGQTYVIPCLGERGCVSLILTVGQLLNQLAKYFGCNILTYGQFRVDTTRLAKTIHRTCVCLGLIAYLTESLSVMRYHRVLYGVK